MGTIVLHLKSDGNVPVSSEVLTISSREYRTTSNKLSTRNASMTSSSDLEFLNPLTMLWSLLSDIFLKVGRLHLFSTKSLS
ncbi:hypothetical protein WA026_010448 [Henosepilachna vigintioctopunctata]|uniref:Uncharacterized protein n=1 Tax=Henosepilachna vigintioctopunctata TaxID=420089 RepID=A0AAW1VAA0_9CUCU